MTSKSQLTSESLINLLENQRRTFTDQYRPLLTAQQTALQKAKSVVAEPQESLKRNHSKKKANNILNDIKNCISHDVFVLCALVTIPSTLGASKLGDYVSTIGRWWEGVDHPKGLTMVSERYGIKISEIPALVRGSRLLDAPPKSDEEARQNPTASPVISTGCTSTPPNETQSEPTAVLEISSNHPNFTGAREQRVIENASLQGIAKVFDEYMCDAIRRVTVQGDLKAAVTTVLPVWGGPVDCLMSLDICEREVEQLAMALFNAKVKWVEQVLHVVLKEGITLIIPHSEATLKGVLDEAIIKVFGPEIHDAITENPVRRRELEEGKLVTECVSMILTKNGAIINLSLGLKGGLQIQNKLYT